MKFLKHLFISPLILILFLFLSSTTLYAQSPSSADTSIGLGGFIGEVKDIKIQSDGKILVAGNFTQYKSKVVNRLIRLYSDGSIDYSFDIGFGADTTINEMAIQADGKIIIGGVFTSFNAASKKYLLRLNSDGSIDNTFNIGTGPNYEVKSLFIQSDGKILVGGFYSSFNGNTLKKYLVRLNSDGSFDTTFSTTPGGSINAITVQPDGKIIAAGYFFNYNEISSSCVFRINSDGSTDNTFNVASTVVKDVVESVVLQPDGKILVGGWFTYSGSSGLNYLLRLNSDGSLDNTFSTGSPVGVGYYVYSLALQPDGKILIGGIFSSIGATYENGLARLNTDGSIDSTFNIGTGLYSNVVNVVTLRSDGRILAGGAFSTFNNTAQNGLVGINADGSLDHSFVTSLGSDSWINTITIQSDKKIIVGGVFNNFNGFSNKSIARFNSDGSIDPSFNIGSGANSSVNAFAVQPDGKVLVGGQFSTFNGVSKSRIVRLNEDGSFDNTFAIAAGPNGSILTISVQPDGKIILGGGFTTFDGVSKGYLNRLNADGSADNSFTATGGNNGIFGTILQPDGKIIVGGYFTTFNGVTKNRIARLNPDGTIDTTFKIGTGANNLVRSMALQPDGKIIAGGDFTSFNGISKNRLVRLNSDGSVDKTFNCNIAFNATVVAIAIQENGKIVLGGNFTSSPKYIIRLNPDGSLDNTFSSVNTTNGFVYAIAIQNNGRIVAGGNFSRYNGRVYNKIVQLFGDPIYENLIEGKIYVEGNKDCNYQSSEKPLTSVIVEALPGPYYSSSDPFGNYYLRVDSGSVSYSVSQKFNPINSELLTNLCATSHTASLSGSGKDTCCFNFGDSIQCSLLNVSLQHTNMIRCFKSNTFVGYCNYGKQTISGTQVKIIYPSYIIPVRSIPAWTSKQDSVLTYDIGALDAGTCGRIIITDSVACSSGILGLTQCIKATISPDNHCKPEDPAWDRSSMIVRGTCINGVTHFSIINEGSGDMTDSLAYRIFANDTLIFKGNYKLISNDSLIINYPAMGQTVRIEADQSPFHPGRSRPRITLEGCGGNGIPGLVITAPQDDLDEEIAITCNQISGSYDPNHKQVMPLGTGLNNNIAPGEELEYTIAFQNTGTDTAYSVRIVDTLDVNLDAISFTEGVSSHPYTLQVSGKGQAVLTFNFYNINLPDSTVNKLSSQGLVSFRVTVPPNITNGTIIKNKANIYFDYNDPVVTNETFHTIDNTVVSNLAKGSLVQVELTATGVKSKFLDVAKVYPNPTSGDVTIEFSELIDHSEIRIYSVMGILQKSFPLDNSNKQQINLNGMSKGIYIYEIRQKEERKAGGILRLE